MIVLTDAAIDALEARATITALEAQLDAARDVCSGLLTHLARHADADGILHPVLVRVDALTHELLAALEPGEEATTLADDVDEQGHQCLGSAA